MSVIPLFNYNPEIDLLGTFNTLVNETNAAVAVVSGGSVGAYTVALLPGAPAAGSIAFATDGRMLGEGPGAGSGCPVFYSAGAWRTYYNCATVGS